MRRLHLVEIEDETWCPASLRDGATDYLQFAYKVANPYATIIPLLNSALTKAGTTTIVDLCSGGGGPWSQILPALRAEVPHLSVTMTDLYPNKSAAAVVASDLGVRYSTESVDATNPPRSLPGFRTMFTGFHHFKPEAARQVLASAVEGGEGIAVFEFTERSPQGLLLMLPAPLLVWLTVPFIRPFKMSRVLWTYPIPILPLMALWDGIVSCLRTYTADELREMVRKHDGYDWEIGYAPAPNGPGRITYIIGAPK